MGLKVKGSFKEGCEGVKGGSFAEVPGESLPNVRLGLGESTKVLEEKGTGGRWKQALLASAVASR